MAPTGRAAKVMSGYTRKPASTIHKRIYQIMALPDGSTRMIRAKNQYTNTLFVVDEASMIGEQHEFGSKSLLDDLVEFVFSGARCKLLLIGDTAQLPPVGNIASPALDIEFMKNEYDLTVAFFELTEVVRQALQSGILANATHLRELVSNQQNEYQLPIFNIKPYHDCTIIEPETFEELLHDCFDSNNNKDAVIICKSNKRANLFNQAIRSRIINTEGEIGTEDRLMVVKNNYYWTNQNKSVEFIANGDMVELKKISHFEEMYGFKFADAEIELTDYPEDPHLEVKILLDTLYSNSPALSKEESDRMIKSIEEDYMEIPNRRERYKEMRKNPWLNALQIKFAYALTCHKTQGGQWQNIFIDSSLNLKEFLDKEDLRWLYTALTRAKEKVYFVNFDTKFFE